MRIGMMADTYKPHTSGVTNYIDLNKRCLEEAGHQVYVFTFGSDAPPDGEMNVILSPGVPLVDTGYYFGFSYQPQAKALLQSMDVVHVHHPFLSGQLALRYCKPMKIPILFTNHTRYDLYIQAYLPILPEGLGETFLQAYLPSFCRQVNLVISPSLGMEKVLRRLGVDAPIEVIPNGVDLKRFRCDPQPHNRAELGLTVNDVALVYTGRLAPEKNLPFLLRSFAGVAKVFPEAHLVLIGDGPERDNLLGLAASLGVANHVHFTGMVPYEEVPGYLAAGDAFVTASVTEVHPLSIIEAMAAGLPVLGIDSPGIGDTVEHHITGLLSAEDLPMFTALLTRLVAEKALRIELGQRAAQAAEQYAIERTSHRVLQRYQELSDTARKKRSARYYVHSALRRWRR